jgi:hypothetical protein
VEDLWTSPKEIVEKKTAVYVHLDFQVITQISNQINRGDKKMRKTIALHFKTQIGSKMVKNSPKCLLY